MGLMMLMEWSARKIMELEKQVLDLKANSANSGDLLDFALDLNRGMTGKGSNRSLRPQDENLAVAA